jgi:hypothetical protein
MARKSHTEGGSNLRFSWHLRWRVINMNCMVAAHYREGAHGEVCLPNKQPHRANTASHPNPNLVTSPPQTTDIAPTSKLSSQHPSTCKA